jgi:CheY-like chemotaxis protein
MIAQCRTKRSQFDFGSDEQRDGQRLIPDTEHCIRDVNLEKVTFATLAKKDCRTLEIKPHDARLFVEGEVSRHPLMFQKPFSSLPLVFGENVLLLNWDGNVARIERVLTRRDAYPINDVWAACLGLYRKATLLPYRTLQPSRLLMSSDAKLAIAIFRTLVMQTERFVDEAEKSGKVQIFIGVQMGQFLDEAEFALVNGDIGTAVARLEAVLSTVHKIIVRHAPQGVGGGGIRETAAPKIQTEKAGAVSILLVDDEPIILRVLGRMLEFGGYQCQRATCSREALQLLVERDFDLVITDLMMPDKDGLNCSMDGRELVLAARRSGSRARIIVLTAFSAMALHAEAGTDKFPCDAFVEKGMMSAEDLLATVARVLRGPEGKTELQDKPANKASEATSEPAPGAASSSPQG